MHNDKPRYNLKSHSPASIDDIQRYVYGLQVSLENMAYVLQPVRLFLYLHAIYSRITGRQNHLLFVYGSD